MKKVLTPSRVRLNLVLCVLIIVAVTIGCMGFKKPWRDYSPKPYSSADWLGGDKIERGRMLTDMWHNSKVEIGSRDQALKTLGEADLKKTIEKREVWLYRMDIGIAGAMDLIPVSFDDKGRGSMGMVKGGTISMATKEDEL